MPTADTPASNPQSVKPVFTLLDEEFLSPEGLAELTGKTLRTVCWWREVRRGPAWITLGRSVIYRKSAVLKWLLDQEVTPRKSRKGSGR